METLLQDIRYGLRMLWKRPGFSLLAILTLALGIGANTAIFSAVNGIMLKSLPYGDADRLYFVWESNLKANFPQAPAMPANYFAWKEQNQVFEHLAGRRGANFNITGLEEPERVIGETVTYNYFDLIGVKPILGRFIMPEEDRPGGERVVVLREGYWQRRFAADPKIIGQKLTLNNQAYTVVGIAPNDHRPNIDLWVPIQIDLNKEIRGMHNLQVLGKLKAGVSTTAAQTEMSAIARQLEAKDPELNTGWGIVLISMHEMIVKDIRPALLILLAAVGFVLLIACANVANLVLVRAITREREIAIRMSLGAGRLRLGRQFLTESLLLSLIGGITGLLLAVWGTDALVKLIANSLPRAQEIGIDSRVLLFTLGISLVVGIILGLVPTLQTANTGLTEILKDGSTQVTAGRRGRRLHGVLVITEVAMAIVLLIGAGLLIRSFIRLQNINPGFNPNGVLTMQFSLPAAKYKEPAQQGAFVKEMLRRVSNLPGVESAATTSKIPLVGGSPRILFTVEGNPLPPSEAPTSNVRWISPDYFKAMNIPLLKGRMFTEQDNLDSVKVVIINENMARQMFPDQDPIGKRITYGAPEGNEKPEYIEIVGIVGDVKFSSLSDEFGMEMYWPYLQDPQLLSTLVVRAKVEPTSLTTAVRGEISGVDNTLPVFNIKPLEQIVAESLAQSRFTMLLLGIFAASALILAAIGIYGVISYSVTQRTQEIGIRMALGAARHDILRMVLMQGMRLVIIGVIIGMVSSFLLTNLMSKLIFGISVYDPITFAVIPILLVLVALLASYIPARRATRVDPLVALRYQ